MITTSDFFLDPLPCLVTMQFEGEEPKFVPNAGAIFTEAHMDAVVDTILTIVQKRNRRCTIRWREASNGVVKHHVCVFEPERAGATP